MTLQSLDIQRRSASPTAAPAARNPAEIAQLIDVSVCIGCKACQVACSEWNELRADVGTCVGVYDNPVDLSSQAWTVMRFAEVEENGKLEWLIRKDGCMHCAEPGCLKACPSPRAIVQHKNGIVDYNQEHCIGCGYCVSGCPFNVPRLSPKALDVRERSKTGPAGRRLVRGGSNRWTKGQGAPHSVHRDDWIACFCRAPHCCSPAGPVPAAGNRGGAGYGCCRHRADVLPGSFLRTRAGSVRGCTPGLAPARRQHEDHRRDQPIAGAE
ncbi:formate dehydrogenase beta subunit [Azospirillum brasilense]|nr:formate dehydrogenase beta subunit [Azospirillum brasilense]